MKKKVKEKRKGKQSIKKFSNINSRTSNNIPLINKSYLERINSFDNQLIPLEGGITTRNNINNINNVKIEKSSNETGTPQKRSILLMIILTIVTLGIHPSVWYLRRTRELNKLKTKSRINQGEGISYLISIFYIFFIISAISFRFFKRDPFPSSINDVLRLSAPMIILFFILVILLITTIGLFIHIAFKTRKIINEGIENKGSKAKVSWFFTLIFNLFYLQYEINRIIDDKEENKKVGAWISFVILIVLIILLMI